MNKHFFSLLCIIVLAVAPSCRKLRKSNVQQKTTKTMIEIDTDVAEKDNSKSITKF